MDLRDPRLTCFGANSVPTERFSSSFSFTSTNFMSLDERIHVKDKKIAILLRSESRNGRFGTVTSRTHSHFFLMIFSIFILVDSGEGGLLPLFWV